MRHLSDFHIAARTAVSAGFGVIRTAPGTRTPLRGSNGWYDWTRDLHIVDYWWTETPDANPAITTTGLVVVDIDLDEDGVAGTVAKLLELTGPWWSKPTRTVLTPSGGLHLWFSKTPKFQLGGLKTSQGRIPYRGRWVDAPHIDIISGGPHVPYPGSWSKTGQTFYRVKDPDAQIQPIPDWFWVAAPKPTFDRSRAVQVSTDVLAKRTAGVINRLRNAQRGERNSTLHWAASVFAEVVDAGGITHRHAVDTLTDTAISIGLGRLETRTTIRSGMNRK
jgi:hypothetical protein